jgi:thymidylate kinase
MPLSRVADRSRMALPERTTASAEDVVDAAAPSPVLVFGSLPGAGQDLDLLVRDDDLAALRAALTREGFLVRGDEWVRFHDCSVDAIDLVPASGWRLPARELDDLFARARPLDGFERLVRPAPHHALLILARLTGTTGALPEKRKRRVEAALAEEPDAWRLARELAAAWKLGAEIDHLAGSARTESRSRGSVPRPHRPRVIALSGIDGSGKSSQAKVLCKTLERLGYEAAVEWTPFGQNVWLDRIGSPAKRLLARSRHLPAAGPVSETGLERTPGTALRERNALVNQAWATVVAFANALSQLRTIARHTRHGRIVVYDRYALDSTVQLHFRYGAEARFSLQRNLITLMTPKPLAAFFLDIPPESSLDRKEDRWTLADLETQARLYREEYEREGTVRVDGLRPRDAIAAEIGEAVWQALG